MDRRCPDEACAMDMPCDRKVCHFFIDKRPRHLAPGTKRQQIDFAKWVMWNVHGDDVIGVDAYGP